MYLSYGRFFFPPQNPTIVTTTPAKIKKNAVKSAFNADTGLTAAAPAFASSAPGDGATTSPGLDSSTLSAAFGAAIGAVDEEGNSNGSDPDIDVGGAPAVGIPGVNPGTTTGAPASTGASGWMTLSVQVLVLQNSDEVAVEVYVLRSTFFLHPLLVKAKLRRQVGPEKSLTILLLQLTCPVR